MNMHTLTQNELTTICGGFEPLSTGDHPMVDNWNLQLIMDQLAREQDAAYLHEILMQQEV